MSFECVADRRGSAVGIDIADIGGADLGVTNRVAHNAESAFVLRRRLSDVVGVTAHSISNDFGNGFCATRARMLEFFQNQNSSAFTDHETVAILVPGTAGTLGVVVTERKGPHGGKTADA